MQILYKDQNLSIILLISPPTYPFFLSDRILKGTRGLATFRAWNIYKESNLYHITYSVRKALSTNHFTWKRNFPTLQLPHLMARGTNSSHRFRFHSWSPAIMVICTNLQSYDWNTAASLLPFIVIHASPCQLLTYSPGKSQSQIRQLKTQS